jgi:formylglycine-generating enzyme required for sulfatase activity
VRQHYEFEFEAYLRRQEPFPVSAGGESGALDLPANFLERTGYRLPTEAEWEHACRAGTITPWSHGTDEELLGKYAWYAANSGNVMHPVGGLKPNGLGLFDMHGNAWQWCHVSSEQKAGRGEKGPATTCILRGGSFRDPASKCRSESRHCLDPRARRGDVGFRVARTYR